MDGNEEPRAPETAASVWNQPGQVIANQMVRAASSLTGIAISTVVWEVGMALRLVTLATDLVIRAPADLAGRAGRALGPPGLGPPGGVSPELPDEEVNRALVLRLYRAAVEADLATARKLVAEDISWFVPSPEPMAGHYRGVMAVAPALASTWRRLGRVRAVELRDVVASPERAAALLRLSVLHQDRPVTLDRWLIFRVEDGRVTEAWGPLTAEPDGAEPSSNDNPDDVGARGQEP